MIDDPNSELSTVLARLRGGDPGGRDALHAIAYRHMRRIAGRLLGGSFARLKNHHDVTSVVHDAWINFDRALDAVTLATEADLTRFLAHKIRQVLLKLVAKARPDPGSAGDLSESGVDPVALAQWTEFHSAASRLPDPQRDIFALHYYLGLPQARVADLLGLSPKQVSRQWIAATEALAETHFGGTSEQGPP